MAEQYYKFIKVLISGGGTGGHIFPAIAIADEIKKHIPDAQIKFVGAKGRMEMEKIPNAGYEIEGINISGFHRKNIWKNILLPFKLVSSYLQVSRIIAAFKPDVVVGVGGYVSGPLLYLAQRKGIPTLIQEQNSMPGVTNRFLSKKADKICVAFPEMESILESSKIVLTGNPCRDFSKVGLASLEDKAIDLKSFELNGSGKTILFVGGSLGARTINETLSHQVFNILDENPDVNIIWQTGKFYFQKIKDTLSKESLSKYKNRLYFNAFIDNMEAAYTAADIIVSRAGAMSISECAIVGKPLILIPSPNVADDHQTKNAQALVKEGAALMIRDNQLSDELRSTLDKIIKDEWLQNKLTSNLLKFAKKDASFLIFKEIVNLAENGKRVR